MNEEMQTIAASRGYYNTEIWLDGKIAKEATRAYVPARPGRAAQGWVEIFDLSDDGKRFVRDGDVATHIEHGLVSWNWGAH